MFEKKNQKEFVPNSIIQGLGLWFGLLAAIFVGFIFLWGTWSNFHNPDLGKICFTHFAATIGLPFIALTSLFIVMIFKSTAGAIEFDCFGLKFKGASGPIIFWVICFLAITLAVKTLWGLNNN